MNRILLVVAVALSAVTAVAALDVPEAARFAAGTSFGSLSSFRAEFPPRLEVKQTPEAPVGVQAGTRVIRLSGNLHLSGSAHVPQGSSFVHINMSGWATLRDQDGRMVDGSIHFSETGFYHVTGSHVSGWARPSAVVSLYENGKFLGSTRIDGSIHVSGWNSNGWVNLSGSGQVSGSLYVQDPAAAR